MAKKEKKPMSQDVQKKLESYEKAIQSEKSGKKTVGSILFSVLLIFLIIFAIFLKSNSNGKVIVFDSDSENPAKISMHTEDAENISATNLAGYVVDKAKSVVQGNDEATTQEATTTTPAETTTK